MSILIKNAWILTQDKLRRRIHGDIYIEDTMITQISEKPISIEADFKINGNKKLVLPGLINMHTHIPMTLLRGYGDDMVLNQWLEERIWPVEAKLNHRYVACGTKLGLLEMITSGTTTFLDMYFFEDDIAEACKEAGLMRVQKSVFLGPLERNRLDELAMRIEDLINPDADKVYIFPMCDADFRKVRLQGQAFDKKLVHGDVRSMFL